MTDDNDNITKLVILVAGLSTIAFLAYLAYKSKTRMYIPSGYSNVAQLSQSNLQKIEQRLLTLESKLDKSLIQSSTQSLQTSPTTPERTVVSMSRTKPRQTHLEKMRSTLTKESFGMR